MVLKYKLYVWKMCRPTNATKSPYDALKASKIL